MLSEAGVLKAPAQTETVCYVDQNGEEHCNHDGSRRLDCRQPWCKFAALMSMRLAMRLSEAYARERKKLDVR